MRIRKIKGTTKDGFLATYLEGYQNIRERLPIGVMKVNSKFVSWDNSHYSFKHWNNSS